jgi:uroporphyrinogen decarboxylase
LVDYLAGQVRAGADALQVFDSWAGVLAPQDYRTHVLPHLHRLFEDIAAFDVPVIMFARGGAAVLEQVRELRADVIGVDWVVELDRAISAVGRERVVQGNLDPMVLLGPPHVVRERARQVLTAGREARAHVFNLGHGISPRTDPAMVELLVDAVHEA